MAANSDYVILTSARLVEASRALVAATAHARKGIRECLTSSDRCVRGSDSALARSGELLARLNQPVAQSERRPSGFAAHRAMLWKRP